MLPADVVELFTELVEAALPITVTLWMCNMLVTTFLRGAFGGWLSFGTK